MTPQLSRLCDIVKEAGELFVEGFSATKEITYKGAVDLMTQYDLSIELFLKEHLSQAFSSYELVGEETSQAPVYPKRAIYIDPIDGTTNFVHGIPFCAISVGLWEEGIPMMGVVYNPILGELYSAQKGAGASLNGVRLSVTSTQTLQRSLIATGFPYTKSEKGRDFEWVLESIRAILPYTRDVRRLGSASLDLCMVARGTFDGYYEVNLKPWDVAAGIVILLEACGQVSTETGSEYQLKDRVIVATNGTIHKALVDTLPKL